MSTEFQSREPDTARVRLGSTGALLGFRIGYVRLFGYGLHWKDTRRHRLLWTERHHVYYQWRVGPWLLTPLKRGERGFRRKDAP